MIKLPQLTTAKLIGIGVGILALVALIVTVMGWKTERDRLRIWQNQVLAATRTAADNPKLGADKVPMQIDLLGQSVAALKDAVARQNAEIASLGQESNRQQVAGEAAVKAAQPHAQRAQASSSQLEASSRSSAVLAKPCEPSAKVKELWK